MNTVRTLPLLALLTLGAATASAQATASAENEAAVPALRSSWRDRHERQIDTARESGSDVVFLGDSITAGWAGHGKEVWAERYAPLKAANFGIGGDSTEHVLWRLQNGVLDNGLNPKVVVLLIGTNNLKRDTAPQIAEGVAAIVTEISRRAPRTKILLHDIFPRDRRPGTPLRRKIAETNAIIAQLDDGQRVFFLPIGQKFIQPDGLISQDIMHDFLHLSAAGYKIWADAMEPKLTELLK